MPARRNKNENENQQKQQQEEIKELNDDNNDDEEYKNLQKEINYNKFKTIVALNKNNNNNNNNIINQKKQIDVDETRTNTAVPLQTPFLMNKVSKLAKNTTTKTTTGKRVCFDLPQLMEKADVAEIKHVNKKALTILKEKQQRQQQQQQANLKNKKNIIFNGTFPIDLPLHSRFDTCEYDPEANASLDELKYAQILNAYDLAESDEDDDEDDVDDDDYDELEDIDEVDEEDVDFRNYNDQEHKGILKNLGILRSKAMGKSQHHHPHNVWSMQELIANPNIPLNYEKMCNEVDYSLADFEKYLDSKASQQYKKSKSVRTFDIDKPECLDKKKDL